MTAKRMHLGIAVSGVAVVYGLVWVLLDLNEFSVIYAVLMCLLLALEVLQMRKKREGV
jgi:hypothetical protein